MTHLKRATEENIIRTWARKQQEMTQYHCQPVANVEGERVTNTLASLLLPSDLLLVLSISFPHSLVGQESAWNVGDIKDTVWIPGLGRSPGRGHGYSLQYSCLEIPMNRGTGWARVHGVTKSRVGHDWSSLVQDHHHCNHSHQISLIVNHIPF